MSVEGQASLVDAVQKALDGQERPPEDGAAAELALVYAREIDGGGDVEKVGPLLLAVLESLGMTPKARSALRKGAKDEPAQSPLDELRQRRAARQRDASTVDTTA